MNYYEERCIKTKAIVEYAEEGFKNSVIRKARFIIENIDEEEIDAVPEILEKLLIEYEALQDARADYERAKERLAEEGGKNESY